MSAQWDITIDQGGTVDLVFTWLEADQVTPVNLAGFTAEMQVRDRPGGEVLYATYSTGNGAITLGGDLGTITLTVAASVTAAYTFDGGVYDLQLTDGYGNVTVLLSGLFTVQAAVTT